MFQFKGTINVVTDLGLAIQSSQTCKIVFIGELNNQIPKNFIEFSILLPPYPALNAEINGDMAAYQQIYYQYLKTNEACFEAIMSIIVAAYSGQNIILYIEEGDNLSHKKFLMDFFQSEFSILLGSDKTMFQVIPTAGLAICLYSFMGGFITFDDVIEMCKYPPMNNMGVYNILFNAQQRYIFIDPFEKIVREFGLNNNASAAKSPTMNFQLDNTIVYWLETRRNPVTNSVITWNKEKQNVTGGN